METTTGFFQMRFWIRKDIHEILLIAMLRWSDRNPHSARTQPHNFKHRQLGFILMDGMEVDRDARLSFCCCICYECRKWFSGETVSRRAACLPGSGGISTITLFLTWDSGRRRCSGAHSCRRDSWSVLWFCVLQHWQRLWDRDGNNMRQQAEPKQRTKRNGCNKYEISQKQWRKRCRQTQKPEREGENWKVADNKRIKRVRKERAHCWI